MDTRTVLRRKTKIKITCCVVFALTNWIGSSAQADVLDNLDRSRNALLDQRKNLQVAADNINRKISDLQRQLDSVNAYLRDTDNALRDVDAAMRH